ncbi:Xaa-Pro peptidase family protein [Candidatus Micrarchaeota archaeon]|nr:Xaa-Pro peptidase family protein [Candidatus Micrarchaeota archaeon]
MLLLYRGEIFDANFFYHAGIDLDHCFLLIDNNKKILFTLKMNESLARDSFDGEVVVLDDPLATLKPYIKNKTVFVDEKKLTYNIAAGLKRFCKIKNHSAELLKQRAVKKSDEVSKIHRAVKSTKEILASLDLKAAKTELDLKKQLLVASAEHGLEPAFDPIVSTDASTAYPHYTGGKRKLGSVVLIDFGVRYQHYCSDITRCFILDGDRKKKKQYETLKNICHTIIDELPNLKIGKNIATFTEKQMKKAGFPKMLHSIGHGVGLDIHELPKLNSCSKDKITNTTFAIEPAFYLKSYGMRYEETVYLKGNKSRIL